MFISKTYIILTSIPLYLNAFLAHFVIFFTFLKYSILFAHEYFIRHKLSTKLNQVLGSVRVYFHCPQLSIA